jgi:hypothetical protein
VGRDAGGWTELLLAKERMVQEYGEEGDESPGFELEYDEPKIGTQEGQSELRAYLSATVMGALLKEVADLQ